MAKGTKLINKLLRREKNVHKRVKDYDKMNKME